MKVVNNGTARHFITKIVNIFVSLAYYSPNVSRKRLVVERKFFNVRDFDFNDVSYLIYKP